MPGSGRTMAQNFVAAAAGFLVATAATALGVAAGPVGPEDGPGTLRLAEGLEATLFAGEPMLSSPSDIDVDADGRVWVCEVVNYRGKRETRQAGDRILVLEDADGDGRADRRTVFHQGRDVDSALGICVIGRGPGRKVVVSCAPEVFILHDDDGDLKSDRKQVLFTKTGEPQHDHSVHAFVVGPDGRWYFNFGNTGRAVHDHDGNPVTDRFGNVVDDSGRPYRQGMVFRCRPDGGDFEVLGHNFRNNYEVAVDSFGTLWQSDNDDDGNQGVRINFVMEHGNYGYVDERTGAGWQVPRTNLEREVPRRHWHQNDPGVVPNLLQTGGGSPAGICVYEGSLLPERFHGALLHCDAGPNVVRAYHLKPSGAGFVAESEDVANGSADRWFRPSDVCVAPDGSVIVADWYDPGVGGHGMGDTEKGRIYRIATAGSKWSVPSCDFASARGAVAALASPNPSTRATALERLAPDPAAAAELSRALETASDPRVRARLAWAIGMLPGQAEPTVAKLAGDPDESMRVIAIRLARRTRGDLVRLAEKLADDPSAAVRREAAISLRGLAGERADRAWAALAARHTAGDRWELEALGIGADAVAGFGSPGQWDGRLAAWLAEVGDGWKSPAGREILWRSRGAETPRLLAEIVLEPGVTTAESLAILRAVDFQEKAAVAAAVRTALGRLTGDAEKRSVILPELVLRLDRNAADDGAIAGLIDEAAGTVAGTPRFVEIVRRFGMKSRTGELLRLAAAEGTPATLAAASVGAAIDLGAEADLRAAAKEGGPDAARLLEAAGIHGAGTIRGILKETVSSDELSPDRRAVAVRALARSRDGARDLVGMAKVGLLAGPLMQVAAVAIASCPWADVRSSAADVLPMPKARGGAALPPVTELLKRRGGDPARGRAVFAGAGTCAKCHVVGSEGRMVGPNLSEIGAKLSPPALYEAILAPSAAISHNFETHTAVTAEGRIVSGLLVSQSPSETVIRGPDGIDVSLRSSEIEELVKQPVSLMPADLAAALSADELVDLVAYLQTLKATD